LKKARRGALLGSYDADPTRPVRVALRIVLDMPDADWPPWWALLPSTRLAVI